VQLYHLNDLYDRFKQHGIAVHAITAEPGGAEIIKRKLIANGLPDVKLPIYSDPSWSLMTLEPRSEIYVENHSHPFLLEAKQIEEHYRMVQPAMVVLDSNGSVIYWWSWKALKAGVLAEDGILPNRRQDDNIDGNTHDVRWRPVPEDLLLKLTEGGQLSQLRVENMGFPTGKDHVNVKKQLHGNPAEHARKQLKQQRQTGQAPSIFNKEVQRVRAKL